MSERKRTKREPSRDTRAARERAQQRQRRQRFAILGGIAAAIVALVVVGVVVAIGGTGSKGNTLSTASGNAQPQSGLDVGSSFPDFSVKDVEGRTVTKSSLSGKPTIIWFTTSYCVPCQVGAKRVAQLEDQLGAKAFNVLVLFVDPKESASDLAGWRQQFARPDWMVAPDTDLASRVSLQYLDTKYLLDKAGVITNFDVNIADDRYLDTVRQAVQRAGSA